jgi:uncharacterized protein
MSFGHASRRKPKGIEGGGGRILSPHRPVPGFASAPLMPLPNAITESPLAAYHRHLREGELAYQYSPTADRAVFYPRLVCPFSGSTELVWKTSAGLGTVHATTVVFPREGAPYNVALIDVDEGFRMMSRVEGLAPEDVKIGMRVKVRIVPQQGDEAPLPVFDLAGASA